MKLEVQNLLTLLNEKQISYKIYEHEAFYTVEESSKLKNEMNMEGAHTKNLFLRDKKRNFFLISCIDSQEVDLKELKNLLTCQGNLSFGSPEYLYEKLGVKPGSVSPYALVNNENKDVAFYLDKIIIEHEVCNFHPLENTRTIQVHTKEFLEFIKSITIVKLIDFKKKEILEL